MPVFIAPGFYPLVENGHEVTADTHFLYLNGDLRVGARRLRAGLPLQRAHYQHLKHGSGRGVMLPHRGSDDLWQRFMDWWRVSSSPPERSFAHRGSPGPSEWLRVHAEGEGQ